MKKISIIINCYNGEKYLSQCISSVLDQTYSNFEIIIFDNYSTDQSKNIINNFKDERLKYYKSNTKVSLYKARNEAIKKTTGEFIAFLDVDDWWDKNYLSSRKEQFYNEEYDFFYTNTFVFYQNKNVLKKYKKYKLPSGKIYDSLAKDYFIIISGLIIRKKIFDIIGNFNSNLNIIGDFDFVMRGSKNFNFHALNDPLIFYRVHKSNFSKLNSEIFFREFLYWFNLQEKLDDNNFDRNKNLFKEKLDSLEINHLLLNKEKNFLLFKKIIKFPSLIKKLKFLIGFFLPKKIIKILKK